jgi:hypothetical protein
MTDNTVEPEGFTPETLEQFRVSFERVATLGREYRIERVTLLAGYAEAGYVPVGQIGKGKGATLAPGAMFKTWQDYAAAQNVSTALVTGDRRLAVLWAKGLRPDHPSWGVLSHSAAEPEVGAVMNAKAPSIAKAAKAAKAAVARKKAAPTGGGQTGTTGNTAGNTPAAPTRDDTGKALAAAFKVIRDMLPTLDDGLLTAAGNGAVTLAEDIRKEQTARKESATA